MHRTEIVAEIGVNHGNSLHVAHLLIDAAKNAGADTVKFQASVPELEVSRRAAPEHYELIKRLVPTFEFLAECKRHAETVGIGFLCTPADEESLERLVRMGVKRVKIASDNLTNDLFLAAVDRTGLPAILSTGMAIEREIVRAADMLRNGVTVLHCTTAYPCPVDEANLAAIPAIAAATRLPVGWSDHTAGVDLAAVAVGLGAVMIEKHLTLDTAAEGPDHRASLEPMDFIWMVESVRQAERARGFGMKRLMPSEVENAAMVRKSLVAKRAIAAGERFTSENVMAKRPGTGRSPTTTMTLFRQHATRAYEMDELIT